MRSQSAQEGLQQPIKPIQMSSSSGLAPIPPRLIGLARVNCLIGYKVYLLRREELVRLYCGSVTESLPVFLHRWALNPL